MATRVFKNKRESQTFTPIEPPAPPIEADPPPPPKTSKQEVGPRKATAATCACGCGREVRPGSRYIRGHATKGKKLGEGGSGRPHDSGYGLFVCGNCKWYKKKHPRTRTKIVVSCKEDDFVAARSKPCKLQPTRHGGLFEPIQTSERVDELCLDEWSRDEMALLQLKVRLRLKEVHHSLIKHVRIGQRVQYSINGVLHRGVIVKLTRNHAMIEDDGGYEVRVRGWAIQPEEENPASGQDRKSLPD